MTPQEAKRWVQDTYADFKGLASSSKLAKVKSFILDNDDEYLQTILSRLEKNPGMSTEKAKLLHSKHLTKSGGRLTDCLPPEPRRSSPWCNPLCQRSKIVLGNKLSERQNVRRVDVGQGMGRQPWSDSDMLPTLLPGSKCWCTDSATVDPQRSSWAGRCWPAPSSRCATCPRTRSWTASWPTWQAIASQEVYTTWMLGYPDTRIPGY